MQLHWYIDGVQTAQIPATYATAATSTLNALIGSGYVSNYAGEIDDFRTQISGINDSEMGIYAAFVSYLAPIGNGVQIDAGRLPTTLGAEVIRTDGVWFATTGAVFGLQPVTYTGVSFTTQVTDGVGVLFGIVNQVYSDTFVSHDNDKAFVAQVQIAGDSWGLNIGGIYGDDSDADACIGSDCDTSVVDVTLTANPTENFSAWANFDWRHSSGTDYVGHGDQFGVSVAGRLGLTDTCGIASRIEYVHTEKSLFRESFGGNDPDQDGDLLTLTVTGDKQLTPNVMARVEGRWDRSFSANTISFAGGDPVKNDQVVGVAELILTF